MNLESALRGRDIVRVAPVSPGKLDACHVRSSPCGSADRRLELDRCHCFTWYPVVLACHDSPRSVIENTVELLLFWARSLLGQFTVKRTSSGEQEEAG